MLKKLTRLGCLLTFLVIGIAIYFFTQTESGQWMLALVMLYGGIMLGGALAHDTVPGTVTEINRAAEPMAIYAGSLRFRYTDTEGEEQVAFRRVGGATTKFKSLEVGDEIDVWVCKSDPSIVRLVGYGTHEPETCGGASEEQEKLTSSGSGSDGGSPACRKAENRYEELIDEMPGEGNHQGREAEITAALAEIERSCD